MRLVSKVALIRWPLQSRLRVTNLPTPAFQDDTAAAKPPKSKDDGKSAVSERPRQLFWEKRLSGMRPSYPDEQYEPVSLPTNLRPVGPGIEDDVVLASISTSLHLSNGTISGQTNAKVSSWSCALSTDFLWRLSQQS